MRCLTDKQIERLVAETPDSRHAAWKTHAEACDACRRRLAAAREAAALVRDVQELRESRKRVKPLVTGVLENTSTTDDTARKSKL